MLRHSKHDVYTSLVTLRRSKGDVQYHHG